VKDAQDADLITLDKKEDEIASVNGAANARPLVAGLGHERVSTQHQRDAPEVIFKLLRERDCVLWTTFC
jgi:hypothetical protein